MCDEQVLEEYLENGQIPDEEICRMIRERKVFPCYFGSALKLQGVEELLKGLERWLTPPVYGTEFGAKVYKISRDDQGNRLTHLKITGGTLKVKDVIASAEMEEGEKVNQIRVYSGAKAEMVSEAEAGMICCRDRADRDKARPGGWGQNQSQICLFLSLSLPIG